MLIPKIFIFIILMSISWAVFADERFELAKKYVQHIVPADDVFAGEVHKEIKTMMSDISNPEERKMVETLLNEGAFNQKSLQDINTRIALNIAPRLSLEEWNQLLMFMESPLGKKALKMNEDISMQIFSTMMQKSYQKMQ